MVIVFRIDTYVHKMGDETENTQTQTQNSQIEWSGQNESPAFIPNIWGRLYPTKVTLSGKHCWNNFDNPDYLGKLCLLLT